MYGPIPPPWYGHDDPHRYAAPQHDPWLDVPWGDPQHLWNQHAPWFGIGGWLLFLGRITGAMQRLRRSLRKEQ